MVRYKISFGNGTAWLESHFIEVDEETTDYGALIDILIDQLEGERREGCFINPEDTVEYGGCHYDDEYVIGGNHGLLLLHYGTLRIEKMEDTVHE